MRLRLVQNAFRELTIERSLMTATMRAAQVPKAGWRLRDYRARDSEAGVRQ
jgi:hypothetical protein